MCPSLPLGRRERDMEAGGEVGGTAPRGHLWGRLQGILAVGLSPSHGGPGVGGCQGLRLHMSSVVAAKACL